MNFKSKKTQIEKKCNYICNIFLVSWSLHHWVDHYLYCHCVKSVQIWTEYRKIRTRKNSVSGNFSCSVHKTILWIYFQNCMCNIWEKREADLTIWHMFLVSTRGYLLGKSRPFERYSEITWPAADNCVICLCLHNAELFS